MRKIISGLCLLLVICLGLDSKRKGAVELTSLVSHIELSVDIAGAVEQPGIYTFDHICLVKDALEEARVLAEADLSAVGLERVIEDGMMIYLPLQDERLISLNRATEQELQTIPGIGPVKAQSIIASRPFSCIEDLMKVKGIGEKSYLKLRTYVTL